jgi:anthraniloyl-CoA monooxygenase
MRILCIGGGPGGLYFATLMKKADPAHQITVLERHRPEDTFGFGVVFSDATQDYLAEADRPTYERMLASCAHWDDIDIHYNGTVIRSTGHGFSGLSRRTLLAILGQRCRELGVDLRFQTEVDGEELSELPEFRGADLIVAADGFNSTIRERFGSAFRPSIDWRPNRFVWLGTSRTFPAFTFYFKWTEYGLWRVHAYQYDREHSTFIVEAREKTWRAAGLESATEDENAAFCEELFKQEL